MDRTPHEISADDLLFQLGTKLTPQIVDVCLPEDIATDQWRVPTARHVPHQDIADFAQHLDAQRPVVAVCQKGLKLSQGTAALLRCLGFQAQALQGGNRAWFEADHPRLALGNAPPPGTVWVLSTQGNLRAMLAAWVIKRWYDPLASVIWVEEAYVTDVAARFGFFPLPHDVPLSEAFRALGLVHEPLSDWIHSVETAKAPVSALLKTLPHLQNTEESIARAAEPLLDAAWMAARPTAAAEVA
ncbi:MAG: rhodanese-like domain-containing protein [Pseudomonadota bacterium]